MDRRKIGCNVMKKWTTVIRPKTGILQWPIKEIWNYRGLIKSFVKRNYEVQYKQTVLGPLWLILGQIFSTGLFSLVFGYVGKFSSEGIPYFLFLMIGNIAWSFFAGCIQNNSTVLVSNAYLFGKVYFPRLIVPLSNCIFELVRFSIQSVVCLAVWIFFLWKGQISFMGGYLILVPFIVLELGILGLAGGLIVSSLTTKYRDLMHMLGFGMQILMYASPVLYPVSQLPARFQKIVLLNPIAPMVETLRFCLTGCGTLRIGYLLYSVVFTIVFVTVGIALYNQTEKTFIDIV